MSQLFNQYESQASAETIRDSRASQLQSCRQRIALFKGLQVENCEDRLLALDKIIQVIKSYIRSDEYSDQLSYYLLTILRLSITCPFNDVRQTFKDFLSGLKDSIVLPEARYKSPSHFILLNDIFSLESTISSNQIVLYPRSCNISISPFSFTPIDENFPKEPEHVDQQDFTGGKPSDEYVRQMLLKTFIEEGRLYNLYRVLAFFPTFFEIYHLTFTKTFKQSTGPLHRTWRSYIGLMVASEQKCQYLVSMMKIDFLYNGGDPNWLLGIDYIPHKLRMLNILILKLARQPWKLLREDDELSFLLNGGIGSDGWSKGELVQATLTIATTLGLCSFILGCGITPEIDMTGGFVVRNDNMEGIENELDLPTVHLDSRKQEEFYKTDDGIGLGVSTQIEHVDLVKESNDLIYKLKSNKKNGPIRESLENILQVENKTNIQPTIAENVLVPESTNIIFEDLNKFIDPALNESIPLEVYDGQVEFMLGEYCFEDHGCDLMNHFLPSLGDDLVTEFTEAISITDWSIFHNVSEEVVDTSPLRNAIWYHTQKLLGVTKEDYTYSDIPTYLNERTMKYIQDLCMTPHQIQLTDWSNLGLNFRPEEKCHVNLLIASARKQAILCYGLYLISEHL